MKDRIGESSKQKKKAPAPARFESSTTTQQTSNYMPQGQNFQNQSQKKSGNGPKVVIGLVAAVVVVVGGFFAWKQLGGNGGGDGGIGSPIPEVTNPSADYPPAGDGITPEQQDEMNLMLATKKISVPTISELSDYITITTLAGPRISANDAANSLVKADAAAVGGAVKAKEKKQSLNGDTVGWMYIPNTNIDYPVVQSRQDNNYYVNKGYDKAYSKDGVIWTDYRAYSDSSAMLSRNNIIFGHNWKNIYKPARTIANATAADTMFALVPSYTHLDFAQKNPFIYYSTLDKDLSWQVFASFFTDVAFDYVIPDPSKPNYTKILAESIAKSEFNYNVNVSSNDKIITLSTCTRVKGNTEDQRYVVMAKLVEDGTTSTNIATNKNVLAYSSSVG